MNVLLQRNSTFSLEEWLGHPHFFTSSLVIYLGLLQIAIAHSMPFKALTVLSCKSNPRFPENLVMVALFHFPAAYLTYFCFHF